MDKFFAPEVSGPIEMPFDPTPSCPAPEMPIKKYRESGEHKRR